MRNVTIFSFITIFIFIGCENSKKKDASETAILALLGQKTIVSGVIASKSPDSITLDNGTTYNTTSAEIHGDNDSNLTSSSLSEGMEVEVKTDAAGNAVSIEYHTAVEGPITSMTNSKIVVLEQTILVDENTIFNDLSGISDLAVDNVVEVDGTRNADGSIQATRIELKDLVYTAGMEVEVYGPIQNLDENAKTFTIGGLTIDYSAAELEGEGTLANGEEVEVEASVLPNGVVLNAESIEFEDIDDDLDDHDASEEEDDLFDLEDHDLGSEVNS